MYSDDTYIVYFDLADNTLGDIKNLPLKQIDKV